MYIRKIVLADDEGTQRKVLSAIIQKLAPQTQIELCTNGKEAWEKVQAGDTELLITDIRMPVMDGMELIRLVSEAFPQIKIVLISAYQEFEYAKNAISCGVSEYLIKPFRVDEVKKLLEKLEAQIRAQRDGDRHNSRYERLLVKAEKDAAQRQLIDMMCYKKHPEKPDPQLLAALSHAGLAAVLRWKIRTLSIPAGISTASQENLLARTELLFPDGVLVPLENRQDTNERRVALLIPKTDLESCQRRLMQLIRQCSREGIVFWTGLSACHPDLFAALSAALQQAEEMLLFGFYYPREAMLFCYPDFCDVLTLPMDSIAGFEKDIRQAVHTENREALTARLSSLKKSLMTPPFKYPSGVRHRISSMVVSILKDLDGMISVKEYDEILNDAYYRYNLCDSCEELFEISLTLLERAMAYFTQESGQYDAVEDIIAYIKKHFTEEISLQQLADRVHFSTNYLSAQIKKKTGMSYVSYLTWLRTEMACKLLMETDLRVMEVAARCGYKDSSYFNRIFCRKYGISPEQYRKAHKKW